MLIRSFLCLAAGIGLSTGALAAPRTLQSCQTLSEPGSYVVGRNLSATGDCFVIDADYVTVDLDGFVVSGNGSGSGFVERFATGRRGTTIRNGVVTGFANGVLMGNSSSLAIERVRFENNSDDAVRAGDAVTVRDCQAVRNGGGLALGQRALVTGNIVNESALGPGISVGLGSNVIGNAVGRSHSGILVAEGGLVTNNVSRNNATYGVLMDCPGTAVSNTLSNNLTANLAQPGVGACDPTQGCCLVTAHNSTISSF